MNHLLHQLGSYLLQVWHLAVNQMQPHARPPSCPISLSQLAL